MFQVKELLKIDDDEFKKLTLEAGAEGLSREIAWPNTILTIPIAEWLKPKEMVIISGVGMDMNEDQMVQILEQAAQGQAACLIFMLNEAYIAKIPELAKKRADALRLPLFSAPWNLSLGLLTNKVSAMIVKRQIEDQAMLQLLTELLFQEPDEARCIEQAKFYGYDLLKPQRVVAVKLYNLHAYQKSRCSTEEEIQLFNKSLWKFIDWHLRAHGIHSIGGLYKTVMVFIAPFSDETKIGVKALLIQLQQALSDAFPQLESRIGFSRLCTSLRDYRKGAREANAALDQFAAHRLVSSFEESGVLQRTLINTDVQELRGLYEYYLDPLLQEEGRSQIPLLDTLEAYLTCNGNVAQAAVKLYIHRNTLLNRLEVIEQLLGHDLKDAYVRNNLFNSLLLRDYL